MGLHTIVDVQWAWTVMDTEQSLFCGHNVMKPGACFLCSRLLQLVCCQFTIQRQTVTALLPSLNATVKQPLATSCWSSIFVSSVVLLTQVWFSKIWHTPSGWAAVWWFIGIGSPHHGASPLTLGFIVNVTEMEQKTNGSFRCLSDQYSFKCLIWSKWWWKGHKNKGGKRGSLPICTHVNVCVFVRVYTHSHACVYNGSDEGVMKSK